VNAGAKRTITTSLPADELAALDRVSERQEISRAEAVRAAIRWYVGAIGRLPPAEDPTADEIEAIRAGEAEFARGETRSLEDVQNELGLSTK
jgi:metal-responsive CopG/Arc/MetJ family transcriptional regulator